MSNLPDVEALAIFAVVADCGSYTDAAVLLGLSKGTVSKAVTRLEQQLGSALFHRTSRHLSLSSAGAQLLPHASEMLDAARQAQEAARVDQQVLAGPIRLGAPMGFGLKRVAPIISAFLANHPQVSIDLVLSDATIDILAERMDATLRIASLPDSSLRARRLCDVEIFAVAAPAYVELHGAPVHPAQLADRPCLAYSNAGRILPWRFVGADGAAATVTPVGPLTVNSGEAMLPLLRAGQGIALLPDFIVRDDIASGALVRIFANWAVPTLGLYLLTPPSRLRSARMQALAEFFALSLRGQTAEN